MQTIATLIKQEQKTSNASKQTLSKSGQTALTQQQPKATPQECKQWLERTNPTTNLNYTSDLAKVFKRTQPTLADVTHKYGKATATLWLQAQITSLAKFINKGEQITQTQITETAELILATYPHLKVTEYMLFFTKLKAGQYGTFFGKLETDKLTNALKEFILYAREQADHYERQEQQQKKEQEEANKVNITRQHYEHLKRTNKLQQFINATKQEQLKQKQQWQQQNA